MIIQGFIRSRYYTPVTLSRVIDLVVLHSMESQEKPGTARNVAYWFSSLQSPEASAHYCLDNKDVIQCVSENDVAWAAPGSNRNGIHLEHAGRAAQTEIDWKDEFSLEMLKLSAKLTADICTRHRIPARFVSPEGLKIGVRGITTHAAVSLAFKKSTHWDPGPGFPMPLYLGFVMNEMNL